MTLAQKIYQKVQTLPESSQTEILDFVEFLYFKKGNLTESEWKDFSLVSALRGMEDELPVYTDADIKEKFQ